MNHSCDSKWTIIPDRVQNSDVAKGCTGGTQFYQLTFELYQPPSENFYKPRKSMDVISSRLSIAKSSRTEPYHRQKSDDAISAKQVVNWLLAIRNLTLIRFY